MDYEFICDYKKIEALENNLSSLQPNLNTYITDIYSTIDEFESEGIWSGEVYNAFKADCTKYKEDLELSSKVIKNYCDLLEQYRISTETLVNNIKNIETVDSLINFETPTTTDTVEETTPSVDADKADESVQEADPEVVSRLSGNYYDFQQARLAFRNNMIPEDMVEFYRDYVPTLASSEDVFNTVHGTVVYVPADNSLHKTGGDAKIYEGLYIYTIDDFGYPVLIPISEGIETVNSGYNNFSW